MKPRTLRSLLTRRSLETLAGPKSFERGEEYFSAQRVRALTERSDTITATVHGTRSYRVTLAVDQHGNLEHSCSCPMGDDGAFCKHCVAVALAAIGNAPPAKATRAKATTASDIRRYLAAQEKAVLVDLLTHHAATDDRLQQRLHLLAAKQNATAIDVHAFRRTIDAALFTGDFVDYRAAHGFAQRLHRAVDSLSELHANGYAAEVIELAEHALAGVEVAIGHVDDSDGHLGEIMARLQALHLQACRSARPDPEALATRLCEWELRGEWDVFGGAAETYADVLGPRGLAVYRALAHAAWSKVPTLTAGRIESRMHPERFRITRVMEALARQTGDVEAVVAVKKRDLSTAYDYLEIAEVYAAAKKSDLALEWAERGVRKFPVNTDKRLRVFLATEYQRRKRHDEAIALIWAQFTELPTLEQYQVLKQHATVSRVWNVWRQNAIALLRQPVEPAPRKSASNPWAQWRRTDRHELVRIFLWEQKIDDAWREATEGGCSDELWMVLARARQVKHPEDALPIYKRQINQTINRSGNDAYRAAVDLLRELRALMARSRQASDFAPYVESIRKTHKLKRNFIQLLDGARWA